MNEDRKYQRNPDFIFRNVAGEAVLIPLLKEVADLDAIYTLNEVGVFIWNQLGTPKSQAELMQAILAEFEVEEEVLAKDIIDFLGELTEAGIAIGVE